MILNHLYIHTKNVIHEPELLALHGTLLEIENARLFLDLLRKKTF